MSRTLQRYSLVLLFGALFAASAALAPSFLTAYNLLSLLQAASYIGLVALGQFVVVVAGELDLAVGAIFSFAAVLVTLLSQGKWFSYMPEFLHPYTPTLTLNPVLPVPLLLVVGLAVGGLFGSISGLLVARLGIPSFMASLGVMAVARGLAYTYTGGAPIYGLPELFQFLGDGRIAGIPVPAVIWALAASAVHLLLTRTVFGRSVYAVGGDREAARLSGVAVARVKALVFVLSGVLSALAGILLAGHLVTADPRIARNWELDALAAVVIGGTSLLGGRGTVVGVLVGTLTLQLLNNVLNLMGVNVYLQPVIKGIVVILTVYANQLIVARTAPMVRQAGSASLATAASPGQPVGDGLQANGSLPEQSWVGSSAAAREASGPGRGNGQVLLLVEGLSKRFPGVQALNQVSLQVRAGEVHCLVGANGAGKSTLVKIVMGAELPDGGVIRLAGRPVRPRSPSEAMALGIACIYQELALVPQLTVLENIFLGHEPVRRWGTLDAKSMREAASHLFRELGLDIPLDVTVEQLGISERQLVALVKALSMRPRVLILDEATSSLSQREQDRLFHIIQRLRASGLGILYISHRMEEIFRIGDVVTVLRDGEVVATLPVAEATPAVLAEMMLGQRPTRRSMQALAPDHGLERPVLRIEDLSVPGKLRGVSLEVRAGEIVGLYGMVGAGKTELLRAVIGAVPASGRIELAGKAITFQGPRAARRAGIGYVPEDRKAEALFLELSVQENIGVVAYPSHSRLGFVRYGRIQALASHAVQQLRIRAPSLLHPAAALSGGNQQKVLLARSLAEPRRLLLLDEPTRGIDVNAKFELYDLIRMLCRNQGLAVLFASSDVEDILQLADRVVVLSRGRVTAEFSRHGLTEKALLLAAMGGV